MANLVVLKFPEADGAYQMLDKLEDLQEQELTHVEDVAAFVVGVASTAGRRTERTSLGRLLTTTADCRTAALDDQARSKMTSNSQILKSGSGERR